MKFTFNSIEFLKKSSGRIHLFTLAFIIFISGIIVHEWWWKVGGIIILILLVEGYYRYRTFD